MVPERLKRSSTRPDMSPPLMTLRKCPVGRQLGPHIAQAKVKDVCAEEGSDAFATPESAIEEED